MNCKKDSKKYTTGGHVKGPGTATSDSIPALLSDGEFVVKAKVVSQPGMLDFLNKLNSGKIKPQKFNEGGLASTAKAFGDFVKENLPDLNPGVIKQRTDYENIKPIYPDEFIRDNLDKQNPTTLANALAATKSGPSPEVNSVDVKEKIYPTPDNQQTYFPGLRAKINPAVVKNRLDLIKKEVDPNKKIQMQKSLLDQLNNLQVSPEEMASLGISSFAEGGLATDPSLFEDVPYDESLFEDVPYNEDLFEDVPYGSDTEKRTIASEVEKQNTTSQQDIGSSRSALIGAGQGATFGFGEELTAPFVAAAGMMDAPTLPNESTLDKYKRLMQTYRDVAREEQEAAQEQQPLAYTMGALTGGIASPGLGAIKIGKAVKDANILTKTAASAATGAGMGAVAGAGEAEGTLKERVPGIIEGAKIGATVGGVLPVAASAAKGIGKLASEATELPMIKRGIESFKRGVKGENLYTEKGLKEAEEAVYKQSEKLYKKIQDVRKEIGQEIEAKIKDADESGETVNLKSIMDNAYKRLDELEASNPGQETVSYIRTLRAELNQLFGIKPDLDAEKLAQTQAKELQKFSQKQAEISKLKDIAPEGFVVPKVEPPVILPKGTKAPNFEVTPSKAREIKQNMYGYTPSNIKTQTGTVSPLVSKPAQVAQDVYTGAAEGLEEAVGGLDQNQKYSIIKDTLKRLISKEKQFEEMDVEKINDMLKKIEDPTSGKSARLFEWTMEQLDEVDPKIRQEFEGQIKDSVDRYKLAKDIQSGGLFSGILGTQRSLGGTAANVAGIIAGKTGLATVGKTAGKGVTNLTDVALNNPNIGKGILQGRVSGTSGAERIQKAMEPFEIQRQVASVVENAEPEFLQDQAKQIREQHGSSGEQLATILDNMADKDKSARRALMYTILQNPAYRKMLGLTEETKK